MDNFDKRFLQFFLENIDYHDGKVILSQDVLNQALVLLNERVSTTAISTVSQDFYKNLIVEEDVDKEVETNKFNTYGYIIMKAITYFLLNQNRDGYKYINYILRSDFYVIVNDLVCGEKISNFVVINYIKYIFARASGSITEEDCAKVFDKYPWLNDLSYNRGFKSINDRARVILLQMVDSLEDIGASSDRIYDEIDNYFSNCQSNYFMKVEFPELTDENSIRNFKKYQFKLILADCYLSLKGWKLQEMDEEENFLPLSEKETHILSLLEEAILNEDYSGINDPEILHSIYSYFLIYNMNNVVRHFHTQILAANDCINILKMVNPIYFMDLKN